MSKTSRFRHRREKTEQKKLRKGLAPKPATPMEIVPSQPEPPIPPLSISDVLEGTNFDTSVNTSGPKAISLAALVKPLSKSRKQLQAWENEGGTIQMASKTGRQKQWHTGANRKDVR